MDPQKNMNKVTKSVNLPSQSAPKVCGADAELGNFVLGTAGHQGTGHTASRLVLHEIEGIHHSSWTTSAWNHGGQYGGQRNNYGSYDPYDATITTSAKATTYSDDSQDWGRKFLAANGGCVYIDLGHIEVCTPEVSSAFDYVAAWHAMLLVARQAMERANAELDHGRRIQVLVNNSDGQGNSYGGHLNFLMSRRAWNDIFQRKLHYLAYLASYQVSSIVITGQGKVGAENGAPTVAYQLSQRADFFENLTAMQTTYARPLVNTRDEALCSGGKCGKWGARNDSPWARLHVIFYDNNLCQVATLLKVGMMQIVLAMLEAGQANPMLILDDPLEAVQQFSHDPTLHARARTASGRHLTAVELQLMFLEEAQRFAAQGGFEGIVPRAQDILDLQADTLQKLRSGDLDAVAGRLDWVLKLRALQRALNQRPELDWTSPQIKHLDHIYSSLDIDEGLYWAYENAGIVQHVVKPGQIEFFVHQPPEDTRAYTRAMLLRLAGARQVDRVDWDTICLKLPSRSGWPTYRTIDLPHPLALTKADTGHLFEPERTLRKVVKALAELGKEEASSPTTPSTSAVPACQEPLVLQPEDPEMQQDCLEGIGHSSQRRKDHVIP
jgi:proteasome accessory factor A